MCELRRRTPAWQIILRVVVSLATLWKFKENIFRRQKVLALPSATSSDGEAYFPRISEEFTSSLRLFAVVLI